MTRLAFPVSAALALAGAVQAQQPTPEMRAQAIALYRVCHADVARLCDGVTPGGGRIIAFLKSHAPDVSSDCRDGLLKAKAMRDKSSAPATPPK